MEREKTEAIVAAPVGRHRVWKSLSLSEEPRRQGAADPVRKRKLVIFMGIIRRIASDLGNVRRQVQAVLETDYFASSLENDRAILTALESLVRGRERDRKRMEALEEEVKALRKALEAHSGKSGNP